MRDEHIRVQQVLWPDYTVLVEDQGMFRSNVLEKEIRIRIGESIGVFHTAWVVACENRLGGKAVGAAELKLGKISRVLNIYTENSRKHSMGREGGVRVYTSKGSAFISCGVVVRQSS